MGENDSWNWDNVQVRKGGVQELPLKQTGFSNPNAALPGACKPIWAGRPWAVLWLWTRCPAQLQVFFASTS